jgi:hypothetical protein
VSVRPPPDRGLHGPIDVWPTPPTAPAPVAGSGPDPRAPLQQRQGDVDRVNAMSPKVYRVQGFIGVTGSGASLQPVKFPVKFIELPAFSFGGSLDDGQSVENGNFPTVSVVVASWEYENHPHGANYYLGATLAINVCGRSDQRMTVHWQCEARCLGNIASTGGLSVEQAI